MTLTSSSQPARKRVATPEPPASREGIYSQAAAYLRWQPVVDRLLAAILLVPAIPVIALLLALVKLSSRGPALFRQVRVGRHGRTFLMYKIRTMRQDAEAATGPVWTAVNDPRVTCVGRLLRALHLDELPQLFNVLKGEMALVGPRPERPEFTQMLAREIPGYLGRLAARPGITGLAQINLPPDTDLDSVRRKLVLDLQYVERAGLLLDLRIMGCTLLRMFGIPGERAAPWCGVRRRVNLVHAPSHNGAKNGKPVVAAGANGHARAG